MIHVYDGKRLYTNVLNPKLEFVTTSIWPPHNPYYWISFNTHPKAKLTRIDFRDYSAEINTHYIEINYKRFKYNDIKENLEYIQALIENDVNQQAIESLP